MWLSVRARRACPAGNELRAVLGAAFLTSGLAWLPGCASGGGSGTATAPVVTPTPTPTPTSAQTPLTQIAPPASFETAEYNSQGGLGQIHASTAYSYGATGAGITVAIIDTPVNGAVADLNAPGKVAAYDIHAATRDPADLDAEGHGTLVAGIIAADRGDGGILGVAYDAHILGIRSDAPYSCGATGDDCSFTDPDLVTAVNYAVSQGAEIINLSLAGARNSDPSVENAIKAAAQAGALVVIASGNSGGAEPQEPAYIAGADGTAGRVVAVGAVDPNGVIADFTNRAGADPDTQAHYLLAPGDFIDPTPNDGMTPDGKVISVCQPGECTGVVSVDHNGGYFFVSGTSFAAPHVSGALALVLDAWPNLTPEAALSILLDTADDYVDPTIDPVAGVAAGTGADAVSGVGVLNLASAFAPVGTASVSLNSAKVSLQQALSGPGGAFGDWTATSGAFRSVIVTDSYNRAFTLRPDQIRSGAVGRAALADLGARERYDSGDSAGFSIGGAALSWHTDRIPYDPAAPYQAEPDAAFKAGFAFDGGSVAAGRGTSADSLAPHAQLVSDPASGFDSVGGGDSWFQASRDVMGLTADVWSEANDGRDAYGFGLARHRENWAMRAELGAETDARTALGGALQTRFGGDRDSARLSAFSVEGARALSRDWTVSGMAEAASARFDGVDVSGVWTSAWSLGLEGPAPGGGALSLVLAQPRRAEDGRLDFSAATGMNLDGSLIYSDLSASLTPSGRELDLEARWRRALGERADIEAIAAFVSQPGHVADADPEGVFWFSVRTDW